MIFEQACWLCGETIRATDPGEAHSLMMKHYNSKHKKEEWWSVVARMHRKGGRIAELLGEK